MSRRRAVRKRAIVPDPRFNSVLVAQFINNVNRCGKKRLAENVMYEAIDLLAEKSGEDGLAVFKTAVENVKPALEVKSRRIGGANYQVPVEVSAKRKVSLALRWIIGYAKQRSEKSMAQKLAAELLQAYKNEGASIRKKVDTHKMAEANRAFAHFRW
ncbi:MAG: 30S ribosomal protein S7 [Chitinivibrionales bacterium]|nr:30S ribosomal protein S7 [Chitinivibrionales bacterium]